MPIPSITRRTALKGLGVAAFAGAIGAPAILRAADQVKVGFMAPLTGAESIYGSVQLQCFQTAVDEINAAGGIGGREIVATIEDDETNAKTCIDKARKLIGQDKVDVIIGLLASFERKAAISVTERAKKLVVYPTFYEGGDCNKYLVCTGQLPNQQIDPLASWLLPNVGKTMYVLGHDYSWPRGSTEQLKRALNGTAGSVVGADFFPFGVSDFGPAFAKVKEAKPDMVWLMLVAEDLITAVKQYRSFDMKPPLIVHFWDEVLVGAVSHAEQAGIVSSQAYFQQIDNLANKAFNKHFAQKFGPNKPVNYLAESVYASTWLYAKAVEKAGSLDPDKVVPAFSQVSYDSPEGLLRIDPASQHPILGTIIARVTNDARFDIIKVTDPIPPLANCKV
jgi:urea transport system substrate-binding protein